MTHTLEHHELHIDHSAHQAQGQKTIRRRRDGACSANVHVNIIGQERHKKDKDQKQRRQITILTYSVLFNFSIDTLMGIIFPSTLLPDNGVDATQEIRATAGETEGPAAEETEHHGNAGVRVMLRR